MKRQKSATFEIKSLNINTLMIRFIVKLKTIAIMLVNKEVPHLAFVS